MKKEIVAIGMFDGVHIGHQKVLKIMVKYANKNKANTVVLTFDHLPTKQAGNLSTLDEKIVLIKSLGIKKVKVIKFDKVKNLTPKEFFNLYLKKYFGITIGYNFKFGKNKEGHAKQIKRYCKNTIIAGPIKYKGLVISSTYIKNSLKKGNIELVNTLLNRKYSLEGKVIKGYGLGKKLGFPTANISVEQNKILPNGIFASYAYINNKRYYSLTYIGKRPTFNTNKISVEIYILKFSKSIYNKKICIELISKIRDDKKFSSIGKLKNQIKEDIRVAHK